MKINEYSSSPLPDFLVVGAARSGTTALYSLLKKNPQIYMPTEKEPMFFFCWNQPKFFQFINKSKKIKAEFTCHKLEEYRKIFKKAGKKQIIGEGSTWYLYAYQTVIPNIKKLYGKKSDSIKIIILLRNPVNRIWSHYWEKKTRGYEFLTFLDAIKESTIQFRLKSRSTPSYDYIGFGKYYHQVKAYLDNFSHVMVILFEEFIMNPEETINKVYRFLGADEIKNIKKTQYLNAAGIPKNLAFSIIDKMIFKPGKWRTYFKYMFPFEVRRDLRYYLGNKIYKKQKLPSEYKKSIQDEYREDIIRLSPLIKKDLNHWMT